MDELTRQPEAGTRARSAFTLIEVMIALTILAFGLMAMMSMQLYAMQGSRSGKHTSQASLFVKSRMELLHRLAWADPALGATGGWTAPISRTALVTQGVTTFTEQTYNVRWRIADVNPTLKSIDVQVQWSEPRRPNRSFAISSLRHNDP